MYSIRREGVEWTKADLHTASHVYLSRMDDQSTMFQKSAEVAIKFNRFGT